MGRKLWIQVVDEDTRDALNNTAVFSIPTSDGVKDVGDLRREVYNMLPDIKDSDLLAAAQLRIYADKTTYEDKNGRALKSSDLVKNLGQDAASALIVEVPASPPKKRLKTLWQEQTTLDPNASALSLDGRGHVWSLAPADISGFGLGQSSAKLCLYCRDAAADLIAFLRDDVVPDGHTGFVVGPPGSGKLSTAAVFALALPRTSAWVVTWIHLVRDEPPICVRLEGNEKKTCKLLTPDLDDLVAILYEVEDTKHHVVVLDGVTQNDTELKVCTGWVRQKWDTRRLVLVTSMSSRRKVKLDDDAGKKAMQHNVPAWSEDEYLNAVEDDELFQSVLPFLDASDDEEVPTDAASMRTWRELILLSKYYFAGGNARYMFGYPTATVMEALDDAVKAAVDNPPAAIGLVWEQSASVIARLYGNFGGNSGLISRYAASALALSGGAELIERFASILGKDSNAAMDGWILDMHFFARIRKGGFVVYEGENEVDFPQSIVVVVDPKNLPVLPTKCWLKPKRYNQGGYDAVYIDKDEGLVRFVQVAKSDRHSFRIQYQGSARLARENSAGHGQQAGDFLRHQETRDAQFCVFHGYGSGPFGEIWVGQE